MASGSTSERPPALDEPLAVDFMNTVWAGRTVIHDALVDPGGLAIWLSSAKERALFPPDRTAAGRLLDLAEPKLVAHVVRNHPQFVELRDALRALASFRSGAIRPNSPDPRMDSIAAFAILNEHAGTPWVTSLSSTDWKQARSTSATPSAAVLSLIALDAIDVLSSTGSGRLRGCMAPRCVLFFTRGHPRRKWCSDPCGNRARVARHSAARKSSPI